MSTLSSVTSQCHQAFSLRLTNSQHSGGASFPPVSLPVKLQTVMSLWIIILQDFFFLNKKDCSKIAFSSPWTSDCSQRFMGSKFPMYSVTKPKSPVHGHFAVCSFPSCSPFTHMGSVKAGQGLPGDRRMTGPRPHTEGWQSPHLTIPLSLFPRNTQVGGPSLAGLLPWQPTLPAWTRRPASSSSTRSAFSRYSVRWVQSSRVVWLRTPRMHLCSRWLATSASTAARGSSRR